MGLLDGNIERQYFVFTLGSRYFGLSISHVTKVISVEKLFQAPLLKEYYLGFFVHDQSPVPLLSIKKRLGLGGEDHGKMSVLIAIGSEIVGLSIDGNYMVVELDSDPEPLPDKFTGVVRKYFTGRGTMNDKNFIVLNIESLV
jgi:chemotaxis signal transduction protein